MKKIQLENKPESVNKQEELIKKLVQVQLQWKFLHWQTFGDAKQTNVCLA